MLGRNLSNFFFFLLRVICDRANRGFPGSTGSGGRDRVKVKLDTIHIAYIAEWLIEPIYAASVISLKISSHGIAAVFKFLNNDPLHDHAKNNELGFTPDHNYEYSTTRTAINQ